MSLEHLQYTAFSRCLVIALGWLLLGSPTIATAKDVSGIYSDETLTYWKDIFSPWVDEIISKEIMPALWPSAKKALHGTKIEIPITNQYQDPFTYDTAINKHTIEIPVLNVKFLHDLISAKLWLDARGFEDKSFVYVLALKNQNASAFPEGRYLSPYEALGVPHKKTMELTNNEPDISCWSQELFQGALLFLLAHEVGHVVPQMSELTPPELKADREAAADFFAFEILARSQFNPAGVGLLFMYLAAWVPNAGNFPTAQEYLDSIETDLHPLTAARLAIIGKQLASDPHHFFSRVPDPDPRILLMKSLGSKLTEMAEQIHSLTTRRELGDLARDIQIASLAIHKKSRDPVFLSCEPE